MNCNFLSLLLACIVLSVPLSAQILSDSNLPIIIISTDGDDIPDEPKINGMMGIIDTDGGSNNINDPFNIYNGAIAIETRGNSTQGFDKKTYSLELRNSVDQDTSVNFFGMGGEEDWILHAMVIDKSQIRIPMSFYFAQKMGHYASEWRYVELIINEEYQGLYLLTEKIKRDDDRVDIAKLDQDDIAGDSVTGGYILRIDWLDEFDENKGFESNFDSQSGDPMTFQWYYPKATKIKEEQANYIEEWMFDFEEAIFANNYINSKGKHYSEYIDLNSFTDFLLINELSKNSDGYKLSTYIHKNKDSKGGRLKAGPIWDFDQTYGVSTVCSCHEFTGWTYLQNQEDCEDLESMPLWWQRLMQDSLFQNRLKCRWSDFRTEFLHIDSINLWIDQDVVLISEAIERNFTQWDDHIGESIWIEPEPIPQSYSEELIYLKTWISNRVNWIDDHIPGNCDDDITSLENEKIFTQIKLFPNPSHSIVNIETDISNDIIFDLYSTLGKIVISGTINAENQQIDISSLAPNVYFLKINNQIIKLIKAE